MRRFTVLAGPLALAALVFACENDDGTGAGPTFVLPESGAFDSSLPDSGTLDVVAPPQALTVVVTSFIGAAVADVPVVFHDATGAVLETKTTGADGKAVSTPSAALAMATVVFAKNPTRRELLTWTGVSGGDVLPVVAPSDDPIAEVEITIPGSFDGTDGPTFNYYAKVGGCDAYSATAVEPITVSLYPHCYTGAGAVLVAGSNTKDIIVAHTLKKSIPVPDGGVMTVTTEEWTSPPADVTVSVTNTSDTSGRAFFSQIANQTAFVDSKPLDGTQTSFPAVSGAFVDGYNAAISFNVDFLRTRVIGKRVAPTSTTIELDAAQLPPELTDASVDATSLTRPVATWTGNMSGMKGGLVRLSWVDSSFEVRTNWSVVVPANEAETGSITVPELPANLAELVLPPESDPGEWQGTPDVTFVDSDLLPDYATWRKLQGVIVPLSLAEYGRVERAVLPGNGSFRSSNVHPYAD
ncbi:MAG TPA: hypothetical protein VM580_09920 [Labilithrix sp.]|nr:hypothetical protein [Labilithrix sp.]